MTAQKHTRGPWMIDGPKEMSIKCRVHRVINDERYPAAFVPAWDQPEPGEIDGTEEALANAHLIAAATVMLETLIMVRDADDDCKRDGLPSMTPFARAKIDAAIAKAEGR